MSITDSILLADNQIPIFKISNVRKDDPGKSLLYKYLFTIESKLDRKLKKYDMEFIIYRLTKAKAAEEND